MVAGAVVELWLGVKAEGRPLESIATPLLGGEGIAANPGGACWSLVLTQRNRLNPY